MIKETLKETLETVAKRMNDYRSLYEQNEMAVRDQIVQPILRALGWNPEDPNQVLPNPRTLLPNLRTTEGFPDYLLIANRTSILFIFIETKKLSVDVEQNEVIRQLAECCFREGVKYGLLTNGTIWILFRAFQIQKGVTMPERRMWKIDLENDHISTCIRNLSTISIGNVTKLNKKQEILDEIWRSLLEEPKDLILALVPIFEKLIKERYPEYEFAQEEVQDFIAERVMQLTAPVEEECPGQELGSLGFGVGELEVDVE
jgi:predicted type IV restriction endonuclease